MKIDYNKVSFVARSPNRGKVLRALYSPKTPTQLSKELKLDRGYVSSILIKLEEKKLVACLTPKEIRHRLYKINDEGNKVLKGIDNIKK